jgi:hypothetical protein
LYNLLVTGLEGTWGGSAYEYERGRCVREYTDPEIAEKYKAMSKDDIAALMAMPCLFAYEDGVNKSARIGWLTKVRPGASDVRVEFEIEKDLPAITAARLKKLTAELDITDWELNRTHWAVKDVNLLQTLMTAGILKEAQIRSRGTDSKLVRFGLTTAITDLHVRPSVFRVPPGKVEADLVSLMMPFEMEFNAVSKALRQACTACSLRCQRADDIWNEAEVIQDIFSLIYRSRIVVCDFSGRNPNVFYEAGIAHTLGKPVIPIVQNPDDIPFDLRHIRFVKYHNNNEGRLNLARDVQQKLGAIIG